MLARRRLFQISLFDILLAMTAAVAMLVSYDSLAPRALVYTFGFLGGLVGSAIAMTRTQLRVWESIGLGCLLGVAAGWIAAFGIEALSVGIPFESAWKWQFRRGRVPATEYATRFGATGGFLASVLSTSLSVFKSRVGQQRARDNVDKAIDRGEA